MNFIEDDVSNFVIDSKGQIWRVIGYCAEPSVDLELVGNVDERVSFGISGKLADGYTRLVKEK